MTTSPPLDYPFIGSEAVADKKLRRHQLRSRFQAVFPDVYAPRGRELTVHQRAVAAWLWSRRGGILAGMTAAAWHGSDWIDTDLPIELIWANVRSPGGLRTYDRRLRPDEFGPVGGVPVTTPLRTAFDLGRHGPVDTAVARLDALARATGITPEDVAAFAGRHRGARHLRRLETVLDLVDPGAESPRESWLRLVLIHAGFPRPITQIPVTGPNSGKRYRIDMGWEDLMVGVEYDGEHHRLDRWHYRQDLLRHEELERLGWIIVRVVAGDRAPEIVRRVRRARESRCPNPR